MHACISFGLSIGWQESASADASGVPRVHEECATQWVYRAASCCRVEEINDQESDARTDDSGNLAMSMIIRTLTPIYVHACADGTFVSASVFEAERKKRKMPLSEDEASEASAAGDSINEDEED